MGLLLEETERRGDGFLDQFGDQLRAQRLGAVSGPSSASPIASTSAAAQTSASSRGSAGDPLAQDAATPRVGAPGHQALALHRLFAPARASRAKASCSGLQGAPGEGLHREQQKGAPAASPVLGRLRGDVDLAHPTRGGTPRRRARPWRGSAGRPRRLRAATCARPAPPRRRAATLRHQRVGGRQHPLPNPSRRLSSSFWWPGGHRHQELNHGSELRARGNRGNASRPDGRHRAQLVPLPCCRASPRWRCRRGAALGVRAVASRGSV